VTDSIHTSSAHTNSGQAGIRTHTRVLLASSAFLLTDAMRDVVSDPSGTAYGAISASGQVVAGKTGTTSDYRDIWFVGYTPYYTCCVWGGYDNNEPLPLFSTCHTYNRVLWSAVMNRVHQDLPAASFDQPESVISVSLCSESHLLPVEGGCPSTYTEYFAAGTQPEQECTIHEPEPETEPIHILEDILDELESESESESETESETQTIPGLESESESESETESDSETETETGQETRTENGTDTAPEKTAAPSDINSLEDLMNRLSIES
jgi:penicillin-binding protein 1A